MDKKPYWMKNIEEVSKQLNELLEDDDFNEEEYNKQMIAEFDAVASMLQISQKEGLQVEVVKWFGDEMASGSNVQAACAYAIGEWIK